MVQQLRLPPRQGAWVPFLAEELRRHTLQHGRKISKIRRIRQLKVCLYKVYIGFLGQPEQMTTNRVVWNNRNVFSRGSGGYKSDMRVWAGLVPSGGGPVPCLSPNFRWSLAVLNTPWLVDASLISSVSTIRGRFPLSASVSASRFLSSYKDTNLWTRSHFNPVWPHLHLITSVNTDSISRRGHIHRCLGVRTWTFLWQTHFNSQQRQCGGTSLVVQWVRICLAMQRTQIWYVVGELWFHMPWGNWAPSVQLLSPQVTMKISHDATKISHDAMKILNAAAKTQHSQINK